MIGRNWQWPPDALRIMVLLDGGGRQATGADAIATHNDRVLLAVGVEKVRVQGFAVFGAELENMPDLDAAREHQSSSTNRAAITFGHVADVVEFCKMQVPP